MAQDTLKAGVPVAKTGTRQNFLSASVDWKWLRKVAIIIACVMAVMYIAGFCVNNGPSMNYVGWIYLTNWGSQPTEVGQIIRFVPADKPAWIPRDHIAGIITVAISPRRFVRLFTAAGRLQNQLEFSFPPDDHVWLGDGKYAFRQSGITRLVGVGKPYSFAGVGDRLSQVVARDPAGRVAIGLSRPQPALWVLDDGRQELVNLPQVVTEGVDTVAWNGNSSAVSAGQWSVVVSGGKVLSCQSGLAQSLAFGLGLQTNAKK
ncbi:MAG: hypothetical protein Athens101428_355 [Candidatus Berkelbacteria bacterium Athens1014_28]|uniref:Uncharacterized protein n=1 Tax=Candidatus Berkelbacteria bacterium Athens1014_28 TaxID=2017145 RepID=A0A554LN71_9BACT|nr:MAG: hypothetical protein Athens101428_355 [Candidatus Berkelbacteria bacterium Athens1014_28]